MSEIEVLENTTHIVGLWAWHSRRSCLVLLEAEFTAHQWLHENSVPEQYVVLFATDLAK